MNRYRIVTGIGIGVLVLALTIGSWAVVQGSGDSDGDIQPVGMVQGVFVELHQAREHQLSAISDSPNEIVCFVPRDLGTNATVLLLCNTTNNEVSVLITTIDVFGRTYPQATGEFIIPAHGYIRACSDPVNTTAIAWQDAILVDFGTLSSYTMLELPPGVGVDGYVVWNDGPEYDPAVPAHTLPLRFSNN